MWGSPPAGDLGYIVSAPANVTVIARARVNVTVIAAVAANAKKPPRFPEAAVWACWILLAIKFDLGQRRLFDCRRQLSRFGFLLLQDL